MNTKYTDISIPVEALGASECSRPDGRPAAAAEAAGDGVAGAPFTTT